MDEAEDIMLNEIIQTETDKYRTNSLIMGNTKTYIEANKMVIVRASSVKWKM
jgi:hypothetical protein